MIQWVAHAIVIFSSWTLNLLTVSGNICPQLIVASISFLNSSMSCSICNSHSNSSTTSCRASLVVKLHGCFIVVFSLFESRCSSGAMSTISSYSRCRRISKDDKECSGDDFHVKIKSANGFKVTFIFVFCDSATNINHIQAKKICTWQPLRIESGFWCRQSASSLFPSLLTKRQ